jgi:inner membrane protein
MDNLSHSVVGLAIGELVQRSIAPEADTTGQALRRRMLLITGWLACNFPDLDLLWKNLLKPPFGYMLHHRGHSHTLLYLLPQALVLMLLVFLLWPAARRLLLASPTARRGLVLVTALGLLMHLLMDFLNSYGIHPFYPFDGRWIYGDAVFIVEPLFWVAFGVPLAWMVANRLIRAALLGVLGAIIVWGTWRANIHWESALALVLLASALAFVQQRAGGRRALAAGFMLSIAFVCLQGWQSQRGKALIAGHLQQLDPGSRVLDISMAAFPSNPSCWIFASIERNDGTGTFRTRRGQLMMAPATRCPAGLAEGPPGRATVKLAWTGESSLARLRAIDRFCDGNAWLRFARMPALSTTTATDVRFSMNQGKNFTSIRTDSLTRRDCLDIPAWGQPRADLLAGP